MLKREVSQLIKNTNAPPGLLEWDLKFEADIKLCTASPIHRPQGRILHKYMTDYTLDITDLVKF